MKKRYAVINTQNPNVFVELPTGHHLTSSAALAKRYAREQNAAHKPQYQNFTTITLTVDFDTEV